MGFHDFANTELVLELSLNSISPIDENSLNPTKKHNPSSNLPLVPTLTLALSSYSCGGSSFSNASVKREREVASEESEKGVIGEDDEEDEDGGLNDRKKLRLTKAQSGLLEEAFKLHTNLNLQKQKQELARDLKLRLRQVEVWFQNRRARTKLKQTEVDCEYLKKCCKTLTDENQRLRQEVQQLKAQKVSLSMNLPAATLTMCPSCERVGDSSSAPKPHFFNPFLNSSSAAC